MTTDLAWFRAELVRLLDLPDSRIRGAVAALLARLDSNERNTS